MHHLVQDDREDQRWRPDRKLGHEFGQTTQERKFLSCGLRAPACAWMKGAMDLTQMALRKVSIYLRRGNIAVAEHLLNRAQIGAALEQMRRETVSQRVRAHP